MRSAICAALVILVAFAADAQTNIRETGTGKMLVYQAITTVDDPGNYISAGIGGTGGPGGSSKAIPPVLAGTDSLALATWNRINYIIVETRTDNLPVEFSLNLRGGYVTDIPFGYASLLHTQGTTIPLPVSIDLDAVRDPRRANGQHDVVFHLTAGQVRVYLFGE